MISEPDLQGNSAHGRLPTFTFCHILPPCAFRCNLERRVILEWDVDNASPRVQIVFITKRLVDPQVPTLPPSPIPSFLPPSTPLSHPTILSSRSTCTHAVALLCRYDYRDRSAEKMAEFLQKEHCTTCRIVNYRLLFVAVFYVCTQSTV